MIGTIVVLLYFEPQALLFDDKVTEATPVATAGTAPEVVAQGDFRNLGDQNYELGPDVDLDRFRSAVVWCERFGVGFAVAPIEQQ